MNVTYWTTTWTDCEWTVSSYTKSFFILLMNLLTLPIMLFIIDAQWRNGNSIHASKIRIHHQLWVGGCRWLKEQGPLMSTKLPLKQVKPSQWLRKQMSYSQSEVLFALETHCRWSKQQRQSMTGPMKLFMRVTCTEHLCTYLMWMCPTAAQNGPT